MKTLKSVIVALSFSVVAIAGVATQGSAGVNVNVGIYAPPAYVFSAPPPVVVIPRTYVYAVPDGNVSILFYSGYWWRPYEGRWYRAHGYNGPWGHVEHARVPRAIMEVPPGYYHRVPPGHQKIPYGQLKKNWKKWEHDKHWSRDSRWHDDRGWDRGRDHDNRRDFHDDRGRRDHDDRGKHKGKGRGRDD
jgi:hypothetical protein